MGNDNPNPTDITPSPIDSTEVVPTDITPSPISPTEIHPTNIEPASIAPTEIHPTPIHPTPIIPGVPFALQLIVSFAIGAASGFIVALLFALMGWTFWLIPFVLIAVAAFVFFGLSMSRYVVTQAQLDRWVEESKATKHPSQPLKVADFNQFPNKFIYWVHSFSKTPKTILIVAVTVLLVSVIAAPISYVAAGPLLAPSAAGTWGIPDLADSRTYVYTLASDGQMTIDDVTPTRHINFVGTWTQQGVHVDINEETEYYGVETSYWTIAMDGQSMLSGNVTVIRLS